MKLLHTALLGTLLLSQVPRLAAACENTVLISTSEARQRLVVAEKALANGKYSSVLSITEDVKIDDHDLDRRLDRVRAVALLRSNFVSMGVSLIQMLMRETPDDPYLKTRLAEGLSIGRRDKEKNHKRALTMLEELNKADLIPDAEGFLVLARLRAEVKDDTGSEKALELCRKRSGKPEQCVLTKPVAAL